jgi:hypothetical protein
VLDITNAATAPAPMQPAKKTVKPNQFQTHHLQIPTGTIYTQTQTIPMERWPSNIQVSRANKLLLQTVPILKKNFFFKFQIS